MTVNKTQEEIPVFDVSLINDELSQDARDIMKTFEDKIFYISECAESVEKYDKAIKTLANNLTFGFEHKEFRDCPICFKFKNDPEEETKWLPFRHFVINMIMWRPQFCLDPDNWNDSLVIPVGAAKRFGPKFIKQYFDANYVLRYNRFIPSNPRLPIEDIMGQLSEILGETTFLITQTTSLLSNFFGISSSIETFIELSKMVPRINELLHYNIDEKQQPSEIEKGLKDAQEELFDLITNLEKWHIMKALVGTESGLNRNQIRELTISPGLKSDFNNNTIPRPINTSYLAGGGLRDLIDLFLVNISGRKSAVINNEFMGKGGHLLILVAISSASVRISKTCMECNSINPIPIEIKTKDHLVKMNGRRYKFHGERKYRTLDAGKDEHLIGETLEFRSPITCTCKDGVCKACYGDLWYTNVDMISSGTYSATIVMNPVIQGILSVKHHQNTNTSPIKFNEPFDQFFSIVATDIVLDPNPDSEIDITEYALVIRREEIKLTEEEEMDLDFEKKRRKRKKKAQDDEDEDFLIEGESDNGTLELEMKYYCTKFQVVKDLHTKGKEPVYYDFEDVDSKELFIHSDFIAKMAPDSDQYGQYLYIELENIEMDEFIFLVDAENNELTKPMKKIQKLLNSKDHEGCNTYEEMVGKMLDLMIASKLDANGIHAEVIIRELVRRKRGNNLKRPDFSKIVMSKDVELMTIGSALKKNPSITTSLSTPYLKDQLINLSETFIKDAVSVFDPLFKPCLATEEDNEEYMRRKKAGVVDKIEIY